MKRWTVEKANDWYSGQPWLTGCNFIPSTAVNQLEMWQENTFDEKTIRRELKWASEIGFNSIRVYLHDLAWKADASGFKNRVNRFLDIAGRYNIKTMFVLFDDCWNAEPKTGRQPAPKPGIHNSGWLQSPGRDTVNNRAAWPRLERYVKDIIGSFAEDTRILCWDLYNEPGNSGQDTKSLPLLKKTFQWARAVKHSQPLTAGIWFDNEKFNAFQISASDIITFHNYSDAKSLSEQIACLKENGRPVVCTEWLRRGCSDVSTNLPVFKKEHVGCFNWGFVSGKTQTIFPWGSKEGDPVPDLWFHDLLKKDGTPFNPVETALFKSLTSASLHVSKYDRVPRGIAKYGFAEWDRALGNHRAVIKVERPEEVAYAYLPWRRRDVCPQAKHVRIVDAQTGKIITNSVVTTCNREYGEVVFEPVSGPGLYYAYYLIPTNDRQRWVWPRSSFPITMYETPHCEASAAWRKKHKLSAVDTGSTPDPKNWAVQRADSYPAPWRDLPEARLVEFQSRGEWHSFHPMEVISTLDEKLDLVKRSGNRPFLLFPESRFRPIRMNRNIPYHWAIRTVEELNQFEDTAQKNEYLVFQIGVYAHRDLLPDIKATWSSLKGPGSAKIPSSAITCFNLEGVNQHGQPFVKTVHVAPKEVQALWFGVDIPKNAKPGLYEGTVSISAQGLGPQTVTIRLKVKNKVMADRGDGDSVRLSRLRWLNSTHAVDDLVCAPYTPVKVAGRAIQILGRTLKLDKSGLPEQATSFIEMFRIRKTGRNIFAAPVRFDAVKGKKVLTWKSSKPIICKNKSSGKAVFQSMQTAQGLTRKVETTVEMDGRIGVHVTLEAGKTQTLDALRLGFQLPADVSRYWLESAPPSWEVADGMKLAFDCPDQTDKPLSSFEFAWIGDYNAGLCFSIAAEPESWRQGANGIFRQWKKDRACHIEVDTGSFLIEAGKPVTLEFAFYVTPFKPLSVEHWDWRYYHEGADLDIRKGLEKGAKVFTQHQGSPANPYINYIFPVADKLKKMADFVHSNGGLFKAYNTIREQSTRTNELWMLRSLGHEILPECTANLGFESMAQLPLEYQLRNQVNEPFTGQLWMCEHLVDDYHSRWHSSIKDSKGTLLTEDSSVQINGASRWSNFYIESQRWLMKNAGVDGLYLDGVTFDRASFLRVRKTLVRQKPEALIDFHGSPAEVWDFFGFGDSLWFGEGADYSREDAYWLVAVSGIPFGIAGEILSGSWANAQRGMVYGISHRYGWTTVNPSSLWKWWDSFQIKKAEMLGYWMQDCPVKTSHPSIKATAYLHKGKRLAIAVASWAKEPVAVSLVIDWKAVGLDPAKVQISVPEVAEFQPALTPVSLNALPVDPEKGWIIEVKKKNLR